MMDDPAKMSAQAQKCRRLAKLSNEPTKTALLQLADEYQEREEAARRPSTSATEGRDSQPRGNRHPNLRRTVADS